METRRGRLEFTPQAGPHFVALRVGFTRPVLSVEVALVGYEAHYVDEDHHVRQLRVELHVEPGGRVDDGWEARLVGTLNLQDDGNNVFAGWIDYLLFVELGPAGPVVPPVIGPIDNPVLEG